MKPRPDSKQDGKCTALVDWLAIAGYVLLGMTLSAILIATGVNALLFAIQRYTT